MTLLHALIVRHANAFALHVIVSSIVLLLALAVSYLPRLAARTRFAILAAGMAKFLVPASLFAPLMKRPAATSIIAIVVPDGFNAVVRPSAAPNATPLDFIVLFAIAICVTLLAITIIAGFRAIGAAVGSALPPASREVSLLNIARKRIGIRHAIDVVRSPVSEAPAVLRVLRPIIVLPADGTDTLDDDELESLLCHECAHVARHDNLLALVGGVIRAFFWFNPLVWLAHRRLAEEREKACDEIVAENAERVETYAQALVKICQSILARPAAGVSCMASAHLKQRMEHIMRYRKSAASAFWHFAMTSIAVLFLFGAVAATAAINNHKTANANDPYAVMMHVGQIGDGLYGVRITARDKTSNVVVWSSRYLKVKAGETFSANGATTIGAEPALGFRADGRLDDRGQATADVEVTRGDDVLQHTSVTAIPTDAARYTGTPITVQLEDADIRDVLKNFAKVTGLEIVAAPGVEGRIDVDLVNVPWDEALDKILKEHGYTWSMHGKTMTVTRQ